ncbi:hypothetical protein GCM10010222_16270 [Streptomyces tanashiensis]|nr:hypothetical protein GCM10010222_16270 [Streptomyces tanashiensis]
MSVPVAVRAAADAWTGGSAAPAMSPAPIPTNPLRLMGIMPRLSCHGVPQRHVGDMMGERSLKVYSRAVISV